MAPQNHCIGSEPIVVGMEALSSGAEMFEDTPEDWTGEESNKDEEVKFTMDRMDNLMVGINSLVDKANLAESSLEEERRLCAREVKEMELLI